MSDDWKRKVDAWKSQQDAETPAQQEATWQRAYEQNLQAFQQHFHCHICGKLAERPKQAGNQHGEEWDHWNIPDDLWLCEICKQWTCGEHLYQGICQTDAEQL